MTELITRKCKEMVSWIIFAPYSIWLSKSEKRNAENLLPQNKDFETLYDPLTNWKPEPDPLFYFDDDAAL